MGLFEDVYRAVKLIPRGKVATYGQVAKMVGTKNARRVGQALHANKDPKMPCHRVVFADGSLAPGYAFGGEEKQKKRLQKEGVGFVANKVDLKYNGGTLLRK